MSRVTVLIPNLNGAAYLADCLESVRAQSFVDWRAVVGDNASSDASVAMVTSLTDRRFRLVRRPRTVGWVANVNLLLAEADSEYIAILHADDWWEPTFLERMVTLLDHSPRSLIATCGIRVCRLGREVEVLGLHQVWPLERGSTCPGPQAGRLLLQGRNRVYAPSVLARRELYQLFPGYEESLPLTCDWLMWLRATTAGDVAICPKALANYRVRPDSQGAIAERDGLWASDLVRTARILAVEWRGDRAPFEGAVDKVADFVTVHLLGHAYVMAQRADRSGAMFSARLARAMAPSLKTAAAAYMVEKALSVLTSRPLRAFCLRVLSKLPLRQLTQPT